MQNAGHISQGGMHSAADTIIQEQHIRHPEVAVLSDEKKGFAGIEARIDKITRVAEEPRPNGPVSWSWRFHKALAVIFKFAKFVGPGALIAVAYVDPDNFQTDVSSGVSFQYHLLFMVLVSNIIAIILQVCRLSSTVISLVLTSCFCNRPLLSSWVVSQGWTWLK